MSRRLKSNVLKYQLVVFLENVVIVQVMFLAEYSFKRHPQGFPWTGGCVHARLVLFFLASDWLIGRKSRLLIGSISSDMISWCYKTFQSSPYYLPVLFPMSRRLKSNVLKYQLVVFLENVVIVQVMFLAEYSFKRHPQGFPVSDWLIGRKSRLLIGSISSDMISWCYKTFQSSFGLNRFIFCPFR
jgi:hypothetical protein